MWIAKSVELVKVGKSNKVDDIGRIGPFKGTIRKI